MKYLDEYRDPTAAKRLLREIHKVTSKPWTLMEVCGGQTHSIVKYGLDGLLPRHINLVHGPGCPVCVTPLEVIDKAIAIASQPDVIFCSFGDMLRVPGSRRDLLAVKAAGGDVRIVYSPLDCLRLAEQHPDKTVVFFAVGFETTAPANAMVVRQASRMGLKNVAVLVSHVLVPPAISAIMASPLNRVQGFLAAGHVCSIMGYQQYESLAAQFHLPIVVTGFEPLDLLHGILLCIEMLERGQYGVENQYARAVDRAGNLPAQELLAEVFQVTNRQWRGIGNIEQSGYRLRDKYREFDAEHRFDIRSLQVDEPEVCISGLIMQGLKKPCDCPAFGRECTPKSPLGATMVSSEGVCAAYYHYGRTDRQSDSAATSHA